MKINKIGLIGMGAIGTVYGNILNNAYGSDFCVIAGESRSEKLKSNGFVLNGKNFYTEIVSPGETDIKFDLVIFCVKNYQLENAIDDVRSFIDKNTVLITILNGVTAKDVISEAFPENSVLYGLSMRIDAVRTPKGVTNTEDGEIQFGNADNTHISKEVEAVQACFNKAGIKNRVFPDMIRTIWRKFMLNVGVNQITAVTGANYGNVTKVETNFTLFKEAMKEVLDIAKASGIDLRNEDIDEFVVLMKEFSPEGKTSMLQDIEAKRKTEVEYFAGTVINMGEKLGIKTPVNHVLYCIIKSLESLY